MIRGTTPAALVVLVAWVTLVLAQPVYGQTDAEASQEPQPKLKKRNKKAKPQPAAASPEAYPVVDSASGMKPPPVTRAVGSSVPTSATTTAAPTVAAPLDLLPELKDTTPPQKLAITAFAVEGDEIPAALVYQLQDGFILGLVRAGVRVIDTEDLKQRLKDEPDLLTCETSPCLKRLGQLVGVRHVVKVHVQVTGNSYRMNGRIYRTTGAAPGAMPVETQSRFCDVCTVTEARETMLRLADGIRVADEPGLVDLTVRPPPPPPRVSRTASVAAMVSGLVCIGLGTVVLATSADRDKGLWALGGGMMGAGALSTVGGMFFYADAKPKPLPAAPVVDK